MNFNTQFVDKVAISISSLCVAHCLIFPLFVTILPSFIALGLVSESFHFWMIVSVVPSSIFALALGCKKHEQLNVFIMGVIGLSCLLLALVLGENMIGEMGEKSLTVLGALLIAAAHVKNFKLCRHQDNCRCKSQHKSP